jgi:hypothetical protein
MHQLLKLLSLLSHLFFVFSNDSHYSDYSFATPFTYSKDHIPSIAVKIGTPPQNINLQINSLSYLSIIPTNIKDNSWTYFDPQTSSSLARGDDLTLYFMNNYISGKICYDNFFFDFDSLQHFDNFGFLLALSDTKHNGEFTKGNLGLLPSKQLKQFSFIENLKKIDTIKEGNYRINFMTDKNLVLGNIYNKSEISNFTFCENGNGKVVKYISNYLTNYWSCNLSHIIFFNNDSFSKHEDRSPRNTLRKEEDQIKEDHGKNANRTEHEKDKEDKKELRYFQRHSMFVNRTAIFATALNKIIFPESFFEHFEKRLIGKEQKKNCFTEKTKINKKILCTNITNYTDFITHFNYSLTFVFNGFGYIVNNTNLFTETPFLSNNYTFRVEFSKENDEIIIGTPFLSSYDVAFDEEKQLVGFAYGSLINFTSFTLDMVNHPNQMKRYGYSYFKIFLIFLAICMVLGLLVFLYRRYLKKQELSYYSRISSY